MYDWSSNVERIFLQLEQFGGTKIQGDIKEEDEEIIERECSLNNFEHSTFCPSFKTQKISA